MRRLRVLCLPGWRTNDKIMRFQLRSCGMESLLSDLVEFIPVNPTHRSVGAPQAIIRQIDPDGPYCEWWDTSKTTPNPTTAKHNSLDADAEEEPVGTSEEAAPREIIQYVGADESVRYLANLMAKHKPVDGLLGFSQGGAAAAFIMALQYSKSDEQLASLPLLRFVVLVSGFIPRTEEIAPIFVKTSSTGDKAFHRFPLPSLHLFGREDPMSEFSLSTAQRHFGVPKDDGQAIGEDNAPTKVEKNDKEGVLVLRYASEIPLVTPSSLPKEQGWPEAVAVEHPGGHAFPNLANKGTLARETVRRFFENRSNELNATGEDSAKL
eukprot:Selendium_serpulae@DN3839_c0_g2_i3.p1